jgi:hypothetical protein
MWLRGRETSQSGEIKGAKDLFDKYPELKKMK